MKPGPAPQPTLEELADRLKVSRRTISRVLRGEGYVAPRTRERILGHLKSQDFVPDSRAADLAAGRVRTIGLMMPKTMMLGTIDNYVGTIIAAAAAAGYLKGNHLTLTPVDPLSREDCLRRFKSRAVGGFLIVAMGLEDHKLIQGLKAQNVPVALISMQCPGVDSYDCDDAAGGLAATRHLASLGRKRIAFMHGDPNWVSSGFRFEGYKKALAEAGLPFDPSLVLRGFYDLNSAESTVSVALARGLKFDALFAANDLMAIGAIKALKRAGLKVPEDVAVIGYDDIPLCSLSLLEPRVSSVRVPLTDIATAATDRLTALIEGQTPEPELRLFPPVVVPRESTAAPRQEK